MASEEWNEKRKNDCRVGVVMGVEWDVVQLTHSLTPRFCGGGGWKKMVDNGRQEDVARASGGNIQGAIFRVARGATSG